MQTGLVIFTAGLDNLFLVEKVVPSHPISSIYFQIVFRQDVDGSGCPRLPATAGAGRCDVSHTLIATFSVHIPPPKAR